MYVRQSDSENRPSRASAFNVRQTIEKRQIQQERRERRALREKIREQLRSLSESRERRDSSGSYVSSVHLSQNSVRSKSMSSLDQDQDDFRSESPLFKVQSSPTLEKEKEEVRIYLFGASNLTESGDCYPDVPPASRDKTRLISTDTTESSSHQEAREKHKICYIERPETWQWTQSWDSLKAGQEDIDENCQKVSESINSVKKPSDLSSQRSSIQSSVFDQGSPKTSWQEYNLHHTDQGISCISPLLNNHPNSLESTKSCPALLTLGQAGTTKDDSLQPAGEDLSCTPPVPPPRRNRLSLSAGQITLEEEEDKPNWIRLAKERRSLRTAQQVDQLSDRASTASKEPEWVIRARKKLESLNVTLTSTTDFNCASSCVTESSSAWSRGGLDALDDLKEETSRIGEELAEEATARVNEDLALHKDISRMLEHNTDRSERSREPSAERLRVSFETSAAENSDGDSSRRLRTRKPQLDEVRFGDLKHDWGGAQTKALKTSNGKQKEMRFGEIQVKETLPEPSEKTKEMRFGDIMTSPQKAQINSGSTNGSRPVMRFGDTPLDLFSSSEPKGPKSSSKFESVAGPDPTKMTAEQLNQNVEEYDFPIPTGKEDVSELMKFLEDSLKKAEVVPEVVSVEDNRPKPKSILKRRSVENVLHELKREERREGLQKVEHRKSASFDWDSVEEEQQYTNSSVTTTVTAAAASPSSAAPSTLQDGDINSSTASKNCDAPILTCGRSSTLTAHHQEGRSSLSSHCQDTHTNFYACQQESHASFPSAQQENHASLPSPQQESHVPFPSAQQENHASFPSHQQENHASVSSHQQESDTAHQGGYVPFPSHVETEGASNSPAKVFSFTFSANQKTRPETSFTDLEEDSLIRQKTQKEAENTRRTEGMKTFTIITNPNDVCKHSTPGERESLNGHSHTLVSSPVQLNKFKSNKISSESDKSNEHPSKTNSYPVRPLRMKLVTQNLGSGGERRKTEETSSECNSKHRVHQVTVELMNEDDQRQLSLKKREEEKKRSSLLEWETLQRQRLEDEEKNRINKNLSMKPVSTKIKELVKMHGSFMSMFSKEKKTDINGTVDGKDDIVFRKVPLETPHVEPKNEFIKNIPVPMKSPYIVKKLLSPSKNASSYVESHHTSRRDLSKSHSPTRRASPASRRETSKPRSSEDKREHTSHRILTESNWKTNRATCSSSSSSPRKPRSSNSPSRRGRNSHIPTSSDKSGVKEKDAQSKHGEIHLTGSGVSEVMACTRDVNESSRSSKRSSPPVPPKPLNLHEKFQALPLPYLDRKKESVDLEKDKGKNSQIPLHYEICTSEGRSSIKDPKNRKEWLNKMLNSLTLDHTQPFDMVGSTESGTHPSSPLKLCSSTNIHCESLHPDGIGEKSQDFPVPPARKSTASSRIAAEALYSPSSKYSPYSNNLSSKLSSADPSVTQTKPTVPPRISSPSLTKSFADHLDISCCSKANISYSSSPTSLRSSVREALQSDQSQLVNGRRGPVSLSSILGDGSSRSSSITSTPLASPRATPERVIKRDSIDLGTKLDVILESSFRDGRRVTIPGEEQKENIAPSPSTNRNKEYKEKKFEEGEDILSPPSPSPYRSSFRVRERSEERRKGVRNNDEEVGLQKETRSLWQTSVHKPFSFTKPSVTLKTMTSDVDPQRVATSKASPSHREDLTTCNHFYLYDNRRYNQDKNEPAVEKSECRVSTEPFTSRYSNERISPGTKVPESSSLVSKGGGSLGTSEGRRLSLVYESYLSRNSKETSSLRSRGPSERSTPDRDSKPVSLSSILSRDVGSDDSIPCEHTGSFQFKPDISFSEELNDINQRYCKDMAIQRSSSKTTVENTSGSKLPLSSCYDSDDVFINYSTMGKGDKTRDSSLEPEFRESLPAQKLRRGNNTRNKERSPGRISKEVSSNSSGPKRPPKTSTSPSKSRNSVVRRNSSLKRNRPENVGGSLKIKKDRKSSEDDPADLRDETIVQNDGGWTKTKTTVRRARLGSTEKARQIVRTNSGKTKKEKMFKANASKALEDWAAGATVHGKLMKKEGQKFSHETEEVVKGGQRTSKSVVRRVVRRGSRRLSGGGELMTETKETSSTGASKNGRGGGEHRKKEEMQVQKQDVVGRGAVVIAQDDGLCRRMKTSTDGERYVTHSVSDKDGKTTYTTEGINNKTTNSLEVIGGEDFNAKREVQGRTGHRVVVERSKDSQGRPSTVVKKITSQSRVVITKTKRKPPVAV
ncbi:hypothetical protein OTU49_015049 [Cherax quadricarinatus]|uniref:Uncharacterized protein n=2 Tax=Cherax quadricarinatus TaxID=27406 RepID=A0AAW0Y266_CHEQU